MSDTALPTAEAGQQAAIAFLDGVSRLADASQLPRDYLIHLFGMFALACVQADMRDGCVREEATERLMREFAAGMGLQSVIKKLSPEEATSMLRGDAPEH